MPKNTYPTESHTVLTSPRHAQTSASQACLQSGPTELRLETRSMVQGYCLFATDRATKVGQHLLVAKAELRASAAMKNGSLDMNGPPTKGNGIITAAQMCELRASSEAVASELDELPSLVRDWNVGMATWRN